MYVPVFKEEFCLHQKKKKNFVLPQKYIFCAEPS